MSRKETHHEALTRRMALKETNEELIARLMAYSKHGAMFQLFLIEGLARYADEFIELVDDVRNQVTADGLTGKAHKDEVDVQMVHKFGNLINWKAWHGCALEFTAALAARNANPKAQEKQTWPGIPKHDVL